MREVEVTRPAHRWLFQTRAGASLGQAAAVAADWLLRYNPALTWNLAAGWLPYMDNVGAKL